MKYAYIYSICQPKRLNYILANKEGKGYYFFSIHLYEIYFMIDQEIERLFVQYSEYLSNLNSLVCNSNS